MKRSFFTIAILFSILTVFTTSCGSDDPILENDPETWTGDYKVYIDDKLVADATTDEVGMIPSLDGTYSNVVTLSTGDLFSIIVSGFSNDAGETTTMDDEDVSVIISGIGLLKTDGSDEMYFSSECNLKRESDKKISFEGTCSGLSITELESYTFSGYVESNAYKLIK